MKRLWNAIKMFFLFLFGLFGIYQAAKIIKAIKGRVKEPRNFLPGRRPETIYIKNDSDNYIEVKLPEGITNDKVVQAGYGTGKKIKVQVKHEKINLDNLSSFDAPDMGLGTEGSN